MLTANGFVGAGPVVVLMHLNLESISSPNRADIGLRIVRIAGNLTAGDAGNRRVTLRPPRAGDTSVDAVDPELLPGGVGRSRCEETGNRCCCESETHFAGLVGGMSAPIELNATLMSRPYVAFLGEVFG